MPARDRGTTGGGRAGLVLLALLAGCAGSAAPAGRPTPAADEAARSEVVMGTVRHIDLEGGFYGIVTDDGRRLEPVNLPREYRKDGVRLRARVVSLRDRVSIRMWGTPVRIIEFERL